jgi:SAM-dependent methyltransferase
MEAEARSTKPSHVLFDDFAETYEEACQQGLALTGESRDYFATQRIAYTARWLEAMGAGPLQRVADFGCGLGHSRPHLQQRFPSACVLGLDISSASIDCAGQLYGGPKATFALLVDYHPRQDRDLVYCNGVFHHIAPPGRLFWAKKVFVLLAPGGYLALWENNPWNPGTRLVMQRIPFDRDAIPLNPPEARRLLVQAGFAILGTRFRFFFPRIFSWLRGLERFAVRVPLGAQYCVLARKPFLMR